jgi:hypothetical protein
MLEIQQAIIIPVEMPTQVMPTQVMPTQVMQLLTITEMQTHQTPAEMQTQATKWAHLIIQVIIQQVQHVMHPVLDVRIQQQKIIQAIQTEII